MIALLLCLLSVPAHALDVVVTLPYLAEVARTLAPDAEVTVLTRATEDPHYISPTPALMAKVGRADLYVENGMNLELWSSRLLDGAGNPHVRPGQPGYVVASKGVPRLEVPEEITRARGDLHPEGNPHIWLDPLNLPIVADNIAAGLARVDSANAEAYAERAKAFRADIYERTFGADLVGFMGGELLERLARGGNLRPLLDKKGLTDRLGGWLGDGASLDGKPVVFYHQSWAYFVDRFGMDVVGYVEDRPGIAPSAAHRDALAGTMRDAGCHVIGVMPYYDDHLAKVLGDEVGARVVTVPGDVGGSARATDLPALYDTLISLLVN